MNVLSKVIQQNHNICGANKMPVKQILGSVN